MIPQKLNQGDEIRIIALSSSLTRVRPDIYDSALTFLQEQGFNVTFSRNLCTLNLLQGTPYMPDINNKVLFIEDDNIMGDYFVCEFGRNLQSLLQIGSADTIREIVFGRFDESCKMTEEIIKAIVNDKVSSDIPIVFGVDFGHVFPMISFPIGGKVSLSANNNSIDLKIIEH